MIGRQLHTAPYSVERRGVGSQEERGSRGTQAEDGLFIRRDTWCGLEEASRAFVRLRTCIYHMYARLAGLLLYASTAFTCTTGYLSLVQTKTWKGVILFLYLLTIFYIKKCFVTVVNIPIFK